MVIKRGGKHNVVRAGSKNERKGERKESEWDESRIEEGSEEEGNENRARQSLRLSTRE